MTLSGDKRALQADLERRRRLWAATGAELRSARQPRDFSRRVRPRPSRRVRPRPAGWLLGLRRPWGTCLRPGKLYQRRTIMTVFQRDYPPPIGQRGRRRSRPPFVPPRCSRDMSPVSRCSSKSILGICAVFEGEFSKASWIK